MFGELRAGVPAPSTSPKPAGEFTKMMDGLQAEAPPADFVREQAFAPIIEGDKIRFDKIEETLRFYRDKLSRQYDGLERQAHHTYLLWIICVSLGFAVLIGALILVVLDKIAQGAAAFACSALVYYIQRIFQQREDQYRQAADQKNEHLEYGNKWLLALQTIDAVEEPIARARCRARLAYELTKKLGALGGALLHGGPGRKRKS